MTNAAEILKTPLPLMRKQFPQYSDDELVVAQNRLGDFILQVYLDHLRELTEARKAAVALQKSST